MSALHEAVSTADAAERTANIRKAFQRKWYSAIERYRRAVKAAGGSGPAAEAAVVALEASWHEALDTAWKEAYRLGYAVRARAAPVAWPDRLIDAITSQKQFASNFAHDLAAGRPKIPGRMSVGARSGLYANGIGGSFNRGTVDAGPDDELIFWRLGICQVHCGDCPALSASGPYSKNGSGKYPELPTYPRAGATQCGSRCCCFLEFSGGDRVTRVDEPQPFVDRALGQPSPPEGLRHPTDAERLQIRDMEARVNYARRMIAQTAGTTSQDAWVQARREASASLRTFQERLDVWSPPRFDVREVVTGRDLKHADVDHLTQARGLDGRTIHRAGAEKTRALLDAERVRLRDTIDAIPADVDAGDVRAMLIRAGAPAELLPEATVAGVPPPTTLVLNAVGYGARAQVHQHLAAVAILANDQYDLDVGPLDADWLDLVLVAGTWVSGPAAEVRRFVEAWRREHAPAIAPWRAA